MSNNRIVWTGLEELKQQLRDLPANLTAEASTIVTTHVDGAKAEIAAAYDADIGRNNELSQKLTIGRGVSVGRFGASVVLKQSSKLGWIYENGTQARHTALGINRGVMSPKHTFLPRVIRWRRRMYEALAELLRRNGLVVTDV